MENPTIGFRLKLLLKHGVVFGLTSSLQSALSFILLPLYTHYLSLEDFGNYNMLLVWAGAFNTLFGLGASSALGRYYYDEKDAGYEKEVVSAAFWISTFGGLLLISLAFAATNYSLSNSKCSNISDDDTHFVAKI
jgi:O-antigen/teichoic acid export membrane protein